MKLNVRELMHRLSVILEVIVGFLLLAALFTALIGLMREVSPLRLLHSPAAFSTYLSAAATLVLGVEFVRMLCTHTLDSVIEIMLLAIARQMIVEHTTPLENMVSVLSMALLYLVRKYLYIPRLDDVKHTGVLASALFGRKAGSEPPPSEEPPGPVPR